MNTTTTIEELQAQRQRLALDAEDGVPGAFEELERVEAELARLRLAAERRELAAKERAARDRAARVAAREARRQDLGLQAKGLARGIDEAMTRVSEARRRLADAARELYEEGQRRGVVRATLRADFAEDWLRWRLSSVVPIVGRAVNASYQRPLSQILGGDFSPGSFAARRLECARELEAAVDALLQVVERLLSIGRELDVAMAERLGAYLRARLLARGPADPAYGRPLAELVRDLVEEEPRTLPFAVRPAGVHGEGAA